MIKEILLGDKIVEYTLTYKNVKNINLRIKPDGTVLVSANRWVSEKMIVDFIKSKENFILKAINKFDEIKPAVQYFENNEIKDVILDACARIYPYYEEKGVNYPEIRFRKMKTRWGSCHTKKGILTFNTNLMYAPIECIEYVIHHEFTHFIVPNHSKKFYNELLKSCPEWLEMRKRLRNIILR